MSHSNSDCGTMVVGWPRSDPSSSTKIAFFSPSQSMSTQSAGLIFLLDNIDNDDILPSNEYIFTYRGVHHTYIKFDAHWKCMHTIPKISQHTITEINIGINLNSKKNNNKKLHNNTIIIKIYIKKSRKQYRC